jgi:L-fuconate dehydratase
LACGARINTVWDLDAKVEAKPLWRLLAEMPAEQIVSMVDCRYIDDAITREEAPAILSQSVPSMPDRLALLEAKVPCLYDLGRLVRI